MDQLSAYVPRKSGSFPSFVSRKNETYLPVTTKPQSKFRLKTLLGHCLYRRVVVWTILIVFVLAVTVFNPRLAGPPRDVLDFIDGGKVRIKSTEPPENVGLQRQENEHQDPPHAPEGVETEQPGGEIDKPTQGEEEGNINGPHWLRYRHLDGYYNGLREVVPFSQYMPEYPETRQPDHTPPSTPPSTPPTHHAKIAKPSIYRPHPDYDSDEYQRTYVPVKRCYIDPERKIPAPDLYAYRGIPQGQPKAALGAYDLLGLREDVCFDRFGRYGPYGLGYDFELGGIGQALDTEREGSDTVWEKGGRINYDGVNWVDAQQMCTKANEGRFFTGNATRDFELARSGRKRMDRIAVVIRTYVGFQWTSHSLLNFRALINEVNLKSGGEYDVHFLLHVRDNNAPIWADPGTVQRILDDNVPREFHGLCTLWSEAQMRLYYPGNFGDTFENPSNGDIHGVYRSAHMPLQHFAMTHPEYAHFWNWEMDMRWTGSYYELFDRLGKWGAKQSRHGIWERSSKYYIPELHGSWESFSELAHRETLASGLRPILGPVYFPGKASLEQDAVFLPRSCASGADVKQCGVGEEADLITLNPLFDADESGWVFAGDVTGYNTQLEKPPRRCAIVTASRLSRRLLGVMHEETWRLHHSMFSEMFPASMALHHGLKAVYAPHPVYLDRRWPKEEIDKAFNGGRGHTSGGHGSPFDLTNEHNHKGTSWYYNSEFAGLLWRRWLGYAQMDGRGENGGRAGEGTRRGGKEEEEDPNSSGRLCLRSMLVHPIKWENPAEQE
ncbi:hypothetical protein GGS23DRAFT_598726 [Durotheca rogersii]|uniref:uncharacterized protein n=1 Tax=Durotheca rogersii TaxID=419775 RepID=UPI00221E9A85|nr:uncharacterized protein GGS23DRAFT_598726 [Durotheca rogersii]KAI5861199.1 hypothetical protein GGS23DRAFT_598726 [Durotheca rogersii]